MEFKGILVVISSVLGVLTAGLQMFGKGWNEHRLLKKDYHDRVLKNLYRKFISKKIRPSKSQLLMLLDREYLVLPTYIKWKLESIDSTNLDEEHYNQLIKVLMVDYTKTTPTLSNWLESTVVDICVIICNISFYTLFGLGIYGVINLEINLIKEIAFNFSNSLNYTKTLISAITTILIFLIITFAIVKLILGFSKKCIKGLADMDQYKQQIKKVDKELNNRLKTFDKEQDKVLILMQVKKTLEN